MSKPNEAAEAQNIQDPIENDAPTFDETPEPMLPEGDAAGEGVETPEQEAASEIELIARKLKETQDMLAAAQDQYIRLAADFDNFRKRKEREMSDVIRFANEELVLRLLPVLDNFDRTLDVIEKTDNLTAVKEGISMVSANFRKQLEKAGLQPIDMVGKPFDPAEAEAITSMPAPNPEQVDTVLEVVEKGYRLKDKVIRFSKVIVGE